MCCRPAEQKVAQIISLSAFPRLREGFYPLSDFYAQLSQMRFYGSDLTEHQSKGSNETNREDLKYGRIAICIQLGEILT